MHGRSHAKRWAHHGITVIISNTMVDRNLLMPRQRARNNRIRNLVFFLTVAIALLYAFTTLPG
ncbi:hypothetical protein [Kushneria phosphatilytica]|uniref:Uncharacterized protein n=1 Tax=Kushneria phosphatilytica TaxID=657387 RepID=A0A1S1NZ16_9GAMM|nr:hypothetical protein [Kushneria phosphatilytica]OHV12921.1 hypothetical protein BH688_02640 [Kushneria phosphatilytica]QEL10786.1 hypothetical protein FY550_06405 [Kushneria phosphatilytica]